MWCVAKNMHDSFILCWQLTVNNGQLLPSGVSVASEARPIIAFYSRFRDICIYIYIYIYIIYIYIYILYIYNIYIDPVAMVTCV